jgi:hypothetical protein
VAGAKLLDFRFDAGSGREFQKNIRLATHTALGELFIPDEFGKCKWLFTKLSRWNDALLQLQELKKQAAQFQRQEARVATPEQKAKVLALAKDLPRLWHAPTTQAKDRKRMLRLLLKDITVEKPPEKKQLLLHIRWQGGTCTDLPVQLPPNLSDRIRYPTVLVDRVRELAQSLRDAQIADQLNREGRVSAWGKAFTAHMVKWIRHRHQIPPPKLMLPGELTVQQVADRLGVNSSVVYYWIARGVILARQLNSGMPYWIVLSEKDEQTLREYVRQSDRIRVES